MASSCVHKLENLLFANAISLKASVCAGDALLAFLRRSRARGQLFEWSERRNTVDLAKSDTLQLLQRKRQALDVLQSHVMKCQLHKVPLLCY